MKNMAPILMIGWQGATFDLLRPWIAAGHLPNLATLVEAGACGTLHSTHCAASDRLQPNLWQEVAAARRDAIRVSGREIADCQTELSVAELLSLVERTTSEARSLMQTRPWHCLRIDYQTSNSPHASLSSDSALQIFKLVDRQIAQLTALLSPEATLFVTSNDDCEDARSDNGDGMLVVCGSRIRAGFEVVGARDIDLAPTILHLLEVAVPDNLAGRVLSEMFVDIARAQPADDEAIVIARLRSLGYIE